MKIRESGMPERSYWETLFDVALILDKLEINSEINKLVDFGCGYGTFTVPSAKIVNGEVLAIDIDKKMLKIIDTQMKKNSIENVSTIERDFIAHGTGVKNNSVDYVMLFNILHHNHPNEILNEAYKILISGGKLGIIHWNHDENTPRGPNMNIRPKPEYIQKLIIDRGFKLKSKKFINLPPYHYGFLAVKQ